MPYRKGRKSREAGRRCRLHVAHGWKPAVENQVTDRTHRLGQTKEVFVYKLVVAGSTEENIRDLQERKADLAAGILAEDHEGTVKFGEDDIESLLALLSEKGKAEGKKRELPAKG